MSTTNHTSFIPMSPELLPRQNLNEVFTIPAQPKPLTPKPNDDLVTKLTQGFTQKTHFSMEWVRSPMKPLTTIT